MTKRASCFYTVPGESSFEFSTLRRARASAVEYVKQKGVSSEVHVAQACWRRGKPIVQRRVLVCRYTGNYKAGWRVACKPPSRRK